MNRWQCPVCSEPLLAGEKVWQCGNNHSFDVAREGYANLLLSNQKRRPEPGDNREMLTARRDFLQAGYYQPLAEEIVAQLAGHLDSCTEPSLVDIGCGEGYYLNYAIEHLAGLDGAGIDISREALRLAGRQPELRGKQALAVASSKRLPLATASQDAVMSVFAPFDVTEIDRILKKDAILLVVAPGPEHLLELKSEIYTHPRLHELPQDPVGFELIEREEVGFTVVLAGDSGLPQLLAMTPLNYSIAADVREKMLAKRSFTTQANFLVSVYRRQHVDV